MIENENTQKEAETKILDKDRFYTSFGWEEHVCVVADYKNEDKVAVSCYFIAYTKNNANYLKSTLKSLGYVNVFYRKRIFKGEVEYFVSAYHYLTHEQFNKIKFF